MSTIQLSDGQSTQVDQITRVTLFPQEPRLLVELKSGDVLRVLGEAAIADADMLDDVRDGQHLHFLVFRVPAKISN
jgi:hypothetical protein